jgi:hypothetical protein
MHSTLAACAAVDVSALVPCSRSSRRVVVKAASSFSDPFVVGLGEPPHLIGSQAKITQDLPERLAPIDGIQEHLAHLGRESLLRLGSEAFPRCVRLRFTASVAVTPFEPAGNGAVGCPRATSAALRIGLAADFMQLLHCPRRPGYQPKGEPAPDDRRRHIACCCRLAD